MTRVSAPSVLMDDGCPIAYRVDGPEDAPVLLFSHALGTNWEMWDQQVEALSGDFQLLRYDSRGHGRSGVPVGSYAIDRLGRDVIELLDSLELDRVAFCGLSLGGMVGQWLGYRAPERLTRLVIANTSACTGPPSRWAARIATVREQGTAGLLEASLQRWFTPAFLAAPNARLPAVRDMLLATDPVGYAGCCAAIRDMDQRRTAKLISAPTLVIAGSADAATPPEESALIANAAPNAQLLTIAAAHLSNVELPEQFTDALRKFIDHA